MIKILFFVLTFRPGVEEEDDGEGVGVDEILVDLVQ